MEEYRRKQHERYMRQQKPDTCDDEKLAMELQRKYDEEEILIKTDEEIAKELQRQKKFEEKILNKTDEQLAMELQRKYDEEENLRKTDEEVAKELQIQLDQESVIDLTKHEEENDVMEISDDETIVEQSQQNQRRENLQHQQRLQQQQQQQQMQQQQQQQIYHPFSSSNFDEFSNFQFFDDFQNIHRNFHNEFQNMHRRFEERFQRGPHSFSFGTNTNSGHNFGFSNEGGESYEELLSLQERIGSVSKGATKEDIESKTIKFHLNNVPKDDSTCVICYDELKKNELVRKLPCMHLYHMKCVDKWFEQSRCCPLCKKDILE